MLPLGRGVVLDSFAGSGSTLAACEALGYDSVGVERDPCFVEVAKTAIQALVATDLSCHALLRLSFFFRLLHPLAHFPALHN